MSYRGLMLVQMMTRSKSCYWPNKRNRKGDYLSMSEHGLSLLIITETVPRQSRGISNSLDCTKHAVWNRRETSSVSFLLAQFPVEWKSLTRSKLCIFDRYELTGQLPATICLSVISIRRIRQWRTATTHTAHESGISVRLFDEERYRGLLSRSSW